jgi:hypothetical protein
MIYISAFCFSEKIAQELQKMIAIDDDESEELDEVELLVVSANG